MASLGAVVKVAVGRVVAVKVVGVQEQVGQVEGALEKVVVEGSHQECLEEQRGTATAERGKQATAWKAAGEMAVEVVEEEEMEAVGEGMEEALAAVEQLVAARLAHLA